MKAIHFVHPTAANARKAAEPTDADRAQVAVATATRPAHRERDFGVGYGTSSGYASQRRYSRNWAQTRFTFA